jgi:hypothetical protein
MTESNIPTRGGGYVDTPVIEKQRIKQAFIKPTTWSKTRGDGSTLSTRLPTSNMGDIITPLIGRRAVTGVVAYIGNAQPVRKTTRTQQTESSTIQNEDGSTVIQTIIRDVYTTAVVGITCDLHIILHCGPNGHLTKIVTGEQTIWEGDVGPGRSQIGPFPEMDNGLSKAKVYYSGGSFNQAPDDTIINPVSNVPGYISPSPEGPEDYPGYPGMAYVVIEGFRPDKFTGDLQFECWRAPTFSAGFSGQVNENKDINLIDMIGEFITNEWGGAGVDISNLELGGTGTWKNSHTQIASENLYGSIILGEPTTLKDAIIPLLDIVDGVLFHDPNLNKISLVLRRGRTREDFKFELGPKSIRDVTDWQRTGWNETIDTLQVEFPDRRNFYYPENLPIPIGLVKGVTTRGRQTKTLDLSAIPDYEIAYSTGARLAMNYSRPSYGFRVQADRSAAYCYPGQVITISYPQMNMSGSRVEVIEVVKNPLDDNSVGLLLVETDLADVVVKVDAGDIPLPTANPIRTVAALPNDIRVIDAPYYFNRARGLPFDPYIELSNAKYSWPIFLALPASGTQSAFKVNLENYPGTLEDPNLVVVDNVPYPAWATLVTPIDIYDDTEDGIISEIVVSVGVGSQIDFITSDKDPSTGERIIFINNEIWAYEDAVSFGSNYKLRNVHRALIDTVPQTHAPGSKLYIMGSNYSYISGYRVPIADFTPNWSFKGKSATGQTTPDKLAVSPGQFFNTHARNISPPRPHNTRVDGLRTGLGYSVGSTINVTWKTRFRKANQITLWADAPENGDYSSSGPKYQTHKVVFIDSRGTVIEASEDVVLSYTPVNSLSVTVPLMFNGPAFLYVEARFDGNISIFKDIVPIGEITGGLEIGYGKSYGYAYGGSL